MKRREVSAGLLALAAVGGSAGPVAAGRDRHERETADPLARIELRLPASSVLLTWVLIGVPGGFLGLDVTQPSRRHDENRMDLGPVPLIGQLTRPLLSRRFAGAQEVGDLVRLGSRLVLLPRGAADLAGKELVIANRDQSWEPAGRTRPVRLARPPSPGRLAARPRIGTAHLKGQELLLLVPPSIVRLGA